MFPAVQNYQSYKVNLPMNETFDPAKVKQRSNLLDDGFIFVPRSEKQGKDGTSAERVAEFLAMVEDRQDLSPKTMAQYRYHFQVFLSYWTLDDLRELDRENAEKLLGLIYMLPKNARRISELRDLNGFELLQKNEIIGSEVIARRTAKKIVNLLSTFFSWAQSRGYVDENPFHRLRVRKALCNDRRYQFSSNDLVLIFSMSDYQRGKFLHSYYYWLPLLLRFTGARLNELCQLYKQDLVYVDGMWGIVICARHTGQRLKNDSSTRFIPLHPALISRGFIEFVKSRSDERVFSELPLVNGYYSHNASKWFARRRESLGLGKGRDAHSFRHTFVDELKQSGTPIEVIQELVGHSSNSVTTAVYSRSYKPEVLLNALSHLDDSHVAPIRPYSDYLA
ncbi:site-specific integrase [Vibrio splendidus]